MTRLGLGLAIAAGILFALAEFTRTGWLQLADSLLWAIIVLGVLLPWLSVARLRVSCRLAPPKGVTPSPGPMQGQQAALELEVRNPWPAPRFGLVVQGVLQVNGKRHRPIKLYVPFVAPFGTVRVVAPLPLERRGLHALGGMSVTSEAPFGLARRRRPFESPKALLVYPAPWALARAEAERFPAGPTPQSRPVRWGEEVSGSRPYAPGDLARDIHWRNYARTGRLMTRSYVTSVAPEPVLVLTAPREQAVLDDLMRLAAGAADLWPRESGRVRLQHGPQEVTLSREDLLRRLALLEGEFVPPASDSLNAVSPEATVVAVAWAGDEEAIAALGAAARRVAMVRVLLLAPGGEHAGAPAAAAALARMGATVAVSQHPLPRPVA